ncbi:DegT/DnrJ/EryC1/StrS family aminotransferase [bacterium]|nr:DegT/DnrJ/EryC1/StrS family aminotransferase [bacterium]
MNIPLLDLTKQYQSIKQEIDQAVIHVLEKGSFILGEEVGLLEKEIASLCGASYGIGVNSGTDALLLSLMAYGISREDEVITTPLTFIATAEVIAMLGAKPVFVDINPKTFNIDVEKIEQAITKKTKAIIPVHLYGQMADMDLIMDLAKKYNLIVIEDAAQAILSEYKGKCSGSIGHTGCFSFFPAKNLGAYGDAGMILTNDKDVAERLKMLRNHGSRIKYQHSLLGCNSRLDEIQAAVLRIKARHITKWTQTRRQIANRYNESLADIPWLTIPFEEEWNKCVYNQYTLKVQYRDKFQKHLSEAGIPTAIHYPMPLHLQETFSCLGYKQGDFPESEKACSEVISLPIYPELTDEQRDAVVAGIRSFEL